MMKNGGPNNLEEAWKKAEVEAEAPKTRKGPESGKAAPKEKAPVPGVVNFDKNGVPTVEEFTIDAGIQIPQFQTYLERYGDFKTVDMADEALFKGRYESFLAHVDVVKGMKGILDGEFNEMGLKLDASQMKQIEELVMEYSVENPKKIVEMKAQFDKNSELEAKVKAFESKIAGATAGKGIETLEKSHADSKAQVELLTKAKDSSKFLALQEGFLNMVGEWRLKGKLEKKNLFTIERKAMEQQLSSMRKERDAIAAREEVKKKYGAEGKKQIQAQIDKLQKEVDAYDSRLKSVADYSVQKDALLDQFEFTKQYVVKAFVPAEILNDMAQASVKRELDKLTSSDPAKAQEFWNDLDGTTEGNPYDLDLKEGQDAEEVEDKLNAAFEKEAAEDLALSAKSLGSTGKAFDGFLSKLREMEGRERIGSKYGPEVKVFLQDTLKDIIDKLPSGDKQLSAKTMMLRRALVTLK